MAATRDSCPLARPSSNAGDFARRKEKTSMQRLESPPRIFRIPDIDRAAVRVHPVLVRVHPVLVRVHLILVRVRRMTPKVLSMR